MALRLPLSQCCKYASPSSIIRRGIICSQRSASQNKKAQRRNMATVVPPVTQDMTSSKGPTAMVFMNMGGPSTTDEVGGFLSRLFVSQIPRISVAEGFVCQNYLESSLTSSHLSGRRRPHPPWSPTKLPWSPHLPPPDPQNPKAVCRHWWWLSYPQVVRVPVF